MKQRKLFVSLCAGILAGAMVLGLPKLSPRAQALRSDDLQDQISELQGQSQSIQDQLDALAQQQSDNYTEIEEMVAQKGNIEQQINLLYQQIDNVNRQISTYSSLIAAKQEELDGAQARFDDLNAKNKERIRAMEEDGKLSYWSVIFKANSFSDLLDRLSMVQEIAAADQRHLKELSEAAEAVSQARESLLTEKAGLEASKAELADSEAELLDKQAESEKILNDLIAQGEAYQKLIEEGEDKQNALMDKIAQMEVERTQALQEEWEAAHPTVPETEPPAPTDPDGGTEPTDPDNDNGDDIPSSGGWQMPCSYVYVSSPFSDGRMHPTLGYVRPHRGIDLAAYLGNPVYASRSGYVTTADYEEGGAGNYVSINHGDGFSSVYMHLNSYIVSAGDYVSAGEVIGYVGTTGLSEGPHLHFGIAYNGTYVNPANYINF